ncbi:MAG: crossover junction endodeoxyribonuclease RuvC [bacterium]|nr:crossover junction endodeoxyribonuclease RuvC [bacterium]MCP5068135.1 crossover junction endodeoxyribonuclease RuvC [bacterium]
MRILGIDPGSLVTGFGVVERVGSAVHHVAHGTLRPPRTEGLASRLAFIHRGLSEVVASYEPELVVVEKAFVGSNPRTALALGQARGAALAVLGAAGLTIDELTPQEIKRAVAGTGGADKSQVQKMVKRLLGLDTEPAEDAADALAAAICRGHVGRLAGLARGPRPRGRRPRSEYVVRRAR